MKREKSDVKRTKGGQRRERRERMCSGKEKDVVKRSLHEIEEETKLNVILKVGGQDV